MSDIPEEIMKEAEEIRHRFWASRFSLDELNIIARALISAEARGMERAAKIAETVETPEDGEYWIANRIAAAIRNGTEA